MGKNEEQIAIYSRKSRFTGKGESIGNQIELCREYVRSVFGDAYADRCVVFEDEGFSGGDLNRPAFRAMMEAVRMRRFRAILVYRLDRISRNIGDFASLIEELTKLGVAFVSIREQFDTGTPMGRAMMYIISVFSQLERETIAERIRDNMHELAKTGRWLGGNTPTGFASESVQNVTLDGRTRKSCRLKRIPREAELVQTIFRLYSTSDSLSAVEEELLRRDLKTKRGNPFTRFSIRDILRNPVYMTADEDAYRYLQEKQVQLWAEPEAFDGSCGLMVYNRTDQGKGRAAVYLPMTEWIVAVGKHPGLIPAKQWIAVARSLERNREKGSRKPRRNTALLTGILYCRCGERMYPKLTGRETAPGVEGYRYVCKRKDRSKRQQCSCPNICGNLLDEAVMDRIRELPEHKQHFLQQMEKLCRQYGQTQDPSGDQMAELRAEMVKKERNIAGLMDSLGILEDAGAKKQLGARIGQLSRELESLQMQIRQLEEGASTGAIGCEEWTRLWQRFGSFGELVEDMSLEEKRAALRSLVRKVVWDGSCTHVILTGGTLTEWDAAMEPADPGRSWCEDSK